MWPSDPLEKLQQNQNGIIKRDLSMRDVVLLVDDDADMRIIVTELLDMVGLKVAAFSDVEKALHFIRDPYNHTKIRAVISDLMMAQRDGIDFLSQIKSNPAVAEVDFYLLTGADISVFKSLLQPYKIKGVITKPFDPDLFIQMFSAYTETKN